MMQELNVYERNMLGRAIQDKAEQDLHSMHRPDVIKTVTVYGIPHEFTGVVFSLYREKAAVKLTINDVEYMLTPEGAKDLGNGLLRLSADLRGEKPKRRRHGHGRKNER